MLLLPGNQQGYCKSDLADLVQETLQDSGTIKTLYDSAKYYSKIDPVLGKNLLHKLISISSSQDSSKLNDYYTLYGNACIMNGDFNEAQYYYNKSLAIDLNRKDTLELIRVYNNLNYLYLLSGRLDLSLQNAHEGVRLLEIMKQSRTLPPRIRQFNNRTSAWVEAYFYSNIGQINLKVGNYNKALAYYKRALSSVEKSGDKVYYANALNDIALTYRQLNQYDEALAYIQKAIAINKEIDNEYGIGLNYQTLGDIYAQTRNLNDAKAMLDEGLEILEKTDDITAQ